MVVLTTVPFSVVWFEDFDGAGFAFAWAAVEEVVKVLGPVDEGEPVGCWISLPCSAMMAEPSFLSCCRS